jgi:hypothetical protein
MMVCKSNNRRFGSETYLVKVPKSVTLDDIDVALGIVPYDMVDGVPNEQDLSIMVPVHLTMDDIVDLHISNISMIIVNFEDSSKMYKVLETYLKNKLRIRNLGLGKSGEVTEDLEAINSLSEALFNNNKREIIDEAYRLPDNSSNRLKKMFMMEEPQTETISHEEIKRVSHNKFSKKLRNRGTSSDNVSSLLNVNDL